jgi:hypothetical protein
VILDLAVTDGVVTMHWSAVAGRSYRVEYTDDFEDTNWNPVGTNILATDATARAADPIGTASQRFYRVVLLP